MRPEEVVEIRDVIPQFLDVDGHVLASCRPCCAWWPPSASVRFCILSIVSMEVCMSLACVSMLAMTLSM